MNVVRSDAAAGWRTLHVSDLRMHGCAIGVNGVLVNAIRLVFRNLETIHGCRKREKRDEYRRMHNDGEKVGADVKAGRISQDRMRLIEECFAVVSYPRWEPMPTFIYQRKIALDHIGRLSSRHKRPRRLGVFRNNYYLVRRTHVWQIRRNSNGTSPPSRRRRSKLCLDVPSFTRDSMELEEGLDTTSIGYHRDCDWNDSTSDVYTIEGSDATPTRTNKLHIQVAFDKTNTPHPYRALLLLRDGTRIGNHSIWHHFERASLVASGPIATLTFEHCPNLTQPNADVRHLRQISQVSIIG